MHNLVRVEGCHSRGDLGAGWPFIYDPAIKTTAATLGPGASFVDANGRGFRLARMADLVRAPARNDFTGSPQGTTLTDFHFPDFGDADFARAANRALSYLDAVGGGHLLIPDGKWPAGSEPIIIRGPNNSMGGPGWLLNGTLIVGANFAPPSTIDRKGRALEFHGSIEVNLMATSETNSRVAIYLRGVRDLEIRNCRIHNYAVGIHAHPPAHVAPFGQMTARIRVFGVDFRDVLSPILAVTEPTGPTFQHADWAISNCTFANLRRAIRNIDIFAMDGVTISNNYFFMPAYSSKDMRKRENVRLTRATNFIISANHFFEAGASALSLEACQFGVVSANDFQFPGQVFRSPFVNIGGGDAVGGNNCNILVAHNVGFQCTSHAVIIESPCGYITVASNRFRQPGASSRYYGQEVAPPTVYGVYSDTGTSHIDSDAIGVTRSGPLVPTPQSPF